MKLQLNPWDSLMICGFSWERAKLLVQAYAKKEGIKVPTRGARTGPLRWKRWLEEKERKQARHQVWNGISLDPSEE